MHSGNEHANVCDDVKNSIIYVKIFRVFVVPVDNMTLDQVFDNVTNVLNVTCGAEDVYPKPEITLTVNGEK